MVIQCIRSKESKPGSKDMRRIALIDGFDKDGVVLRAPLTRELTGYARRGPLPWRREYSRGLFRSQRCGCQPSPPSWTQKKV